MIVITISAMNSSSGNNTINILAVANFQTLNTFIKMNAICTITKNTLPAIPLIVDSSKSLFLYLRINSPNYCIDTSNIIPEII